MDNKVKQKHGNNFIPASPRPRVSASLRIRVLFFGATADAVGEREIEIDLEDETRSQTAFAAVLEKFPQLNQHSLLFAVNREYANGGETIQNGDELAIFTAVSGG